MAKRASTVLTDALLRTIQPKEKPYEISDAGKTGLRCRVEPSGFIGFYAVIKGKRKSLGSYPKVSLKAARHSIDVLRVAASVPDVEQATPTEITISSFYEDHYVHSLGNLKRPALALYQAKIFLEPIWNDTFHVLTRSWILNRRNELKAKYANANIKNQVWAVMRLINLAIEHKIMSSNPAHKLKPLPLPMHRRAPSQDQWDVLIKTASDWLGDSNLEKQLFGLFVLTVANTGARAGEVGQLRLDDVHLDANLEMPYLELRSEITKTAKSRLIPLVDYMATLWRYWKPRLSSTPVPFSLFYPKRYLKLWDKLIMEAGIDSTARFTPHALRHAVAERLCKTAGIYLAQQILGHTQLSTLQIYLRPTKEEGLSVASALALGTRSALNDQHKAIRALLSEQVRDKVAAMKAGNMKHVRPRIKKKTEEV
jgi:integrase